MGLTGFVRAIIVFKEVPKFIWENRLSSVFVIPLVVNLVLTLGLFFLVDLVAESLIHYLYVSMDIESSANGGITFIMKLMVHILLGGLIAFVYQYISLIVLSPFLSIIAERVLNIVYGKNKNNQWSTVFSVILRGVKVAVRNIFLQLVISLFVFGLLQLLVITVPIIPLILFFINAYFMGFAFKDYVSEYHELTFEKSITTIKGQKGSLIGIGGVYQLLLFVPVLGLLFASTLALVGTCLLERKVNAQIDSGL